VRGSFSHADLPLGHIQVVSPSTDYDYAKAVALSPVPVIGHETGQFQVYPNFEEMGKYTGVQKPWNFKVFAARLKQAGMYDQRKDFFNASGTLAARIGGWFVRSSGRAIRHGRRHRLQPVFQYG
jgi:hypothetical protein